MQAGILQWLHNVKSQVVHDQSDKKSPFSKGTYPHSVIAKSTKGKDTRAPPAPTVNAKSAMERQPNKSATATWTNLRTGWWKPLKGSQDTSRIYKAHYKTQSFHQSFRMIRSTPQHGSMLRSWLWSSRPWLRSCTKLGWERKGWMTLALHPHKWIKWGKILCNYELSVNCWIVRRFPEILPSIWDQPYIN